MFEMFEAPALSKFERFNRRMHVISWSFRLVRRFKSSVKGVNVSSCDIYHLLLCGITADNVINIFLINGVLLQPTASNLLLIRMKMFITLSTHSSILYNPPVAFVHVHSNENVGGSEYLASEGVEGPLAKDQYLPLSEQNAAF